MFDANTRRTLAVACAVAGLMMVPRLAPAQQTRLSDKDVKQLTETIDHDAGKFRNALDSRFKSAILRGPDGEVNVKKFLDDFEENIKRMRDRVKPGYAASSEVQAVLRQGTAIDGYVKSQPAGAKGASEWDRVAADLDALAHAYGTSFPLAADAPVRRIGDQETASALEGITRDASRLKDAVGKEKEIEKPQREAVKRQAEALA